MKVFGIFSFLWKIYVGLVFVFFAILLYPAFLLVLSTKKWKRKSFNLFVFWSWAMRICCFYFVKKVKNTHLPDGPYIIIANHSSYLDIFFMYSILSKHPFLFLGKSEILSYPIIRTFFKGLNIPVHRKNSRKAATSFIMAKKAVKLGWSLVIFPEGGIPEEDHPKMIKFKDGAFRLAKDLEIPIVPVSFTNHYRLFSDPLDILGPAHPGVSHVYIHPFVPVSKIKELSVRELNEYCHAIINAPILAEHPHIKIN